MFVKVIRSGSETTYECDLVSVQPGNKGGHVLVTMERSAKEPLILECEKETTGVYLMNEQGETIDKYVWPAAA